MHLNALFLICIPLVQEVYAVHLIIRSWPVLFFFPFRINSVMNYEQSFADSYLFTLHSRQALGTACQTALLNPLATRITSNS